MPEVELIFVGMISCESYNHASMNGYVPGLLRGKMCNVAEPRLKHDFGWKI